MQTTALSWWVLVLTCSAHDVGIVMGCQILPMLLVSPYVGVVTDRVKNKPGLVKVLKAGMAGQAAALGVL